MKRGGKFIGTVAMLSIAACTGEQGKLQIRASATPLAAGHQAVPFRIAEARGHLAIGNVALALEAFRKALREEPSSIDAMMGVAACYDRMARFDLARRHYESALAIAPGNTQLLGAFAGSLDLQGRKSEAASVRAEINQRIALAAQKSAPQPAAVPTAPSHSVEVALAEQARPVKAAPRHTSVERAPAPLPIPAEAVTPPPRAVATPAIGRSVTVALPPARPVTQAVPAKPAVRSAVSAVLPPARPANAQPPAKPVVETAAKAPLPPARPVTALPAKPVVETAAKAPLPPAAPVVAPLAEPAVAAIAPPPPARPVTAPLPAKTAIETVAAIPPARPVTAPAAKPAAAPAAEIARAEPEVMPETVAENTGPRLERTSLREVTLITAAAPQWRALTVKRTQRSATVRFVPLRQASLSLSGIRLLNAARVNRLAARTRSYLVGRGWSPMVIGDAPQVRARSVIFYPPHRRRTAQRLSAQFGFMIAPRPGARQITVLLGRDAARVSALRASG